MCFTINLHTTRDAIEKRFNADASALADFEYRYFYRAFENPRIPVITQEEPGKIQLLHWGLIPSWTKNAVQADSIRRSTYNARSESIDEKPSFRRSFEKKRCWVLAKGFFEWQHIGKQKYPWYIQKFNEDIFAFAGIYDQWMSPENEEKRSTFSIVTTRANALMEKIHNTKKRMPVILNPAVEAMWLNENTSPENLKKLLEPFDDKILKAYTIRRSLSAADADPGDERIIEPYEYPIDASLF